MVENSEVNLSGVSKVKRRSKKGMTKVGVMKSYESQKVYSCPANLFLAG